MLCKMEWAFYINRMSFFSFVWFCHILLALQVVLGPVFSLTDVRLETYLVSKADHHRLTYVHCSSTAKLACNANCAYSKTDTAMQGATKLIERWLKIKRFQLMWRDSGLTWILESSCVKCSFVWFCLCCILCLQWSEARPVLSHVPLSSGFSSVLLLQCNHGVLHYFKYSYSSPPLFFL